MRSRGPLLAALWALVPAPVFAEVMDKELSIPEIWVSLLCGVLLCAVATGLWRWLLVPSFAVGLYIGVGYAWTEWFDPGVGPAIRAEAGEGYGYHANAAVALLLSAHVAGWFLSSWQSVVTLRWRAVDSVSSNRRLNAFAYAAALLLVMVVAVAGLAVSRWIWVSPVMLIGVAFLGWTAIAYLRAGTSAP
jgi:hypothetical protein